LSGGVPAGVVVGDVVVIATMPTALLRNLTVQNNRARGIVLKNRGTLVDGCTFINNTGECILIATDCGYWWEGSPTLNIVVQNSYLDGCNFAAGATYGAIFVAVESWYPGMSNPPPGAHQGITIAGNVIQNIPTGGGIYLGSAQNVSIYNNFIQTTADLPILYCNTKDVTVVNNEFTPSSPFSRYFVENNCSLYESSNINEETNAACTGLYAQYFNNLDLEGNAVISQRNPNLNFSWVDTSPGSEIPNEIPWSAQWQGVLTVSAPLTINTLATHASDGIRVWLDNELLIDSWIDQDTADNYAVLPIPLSNSSHWLVVDYYHDSHPAVATLYWSSDGGNNKEIIPSSALSSPYCFLPLVNDTDSVSIASHTRHPTNSLIASILVVLMAIVGM